MPHLLPKGGIRERREKGAGAGRTVSHWLLRTVFRYSHRGQGLGIYLLGPGALRGLWCLQMAPALPTSCTPGPSICSLFVYWEKELRLSGLGARENRFEETCLSGRLHHFTSLTPLLCLPLQNGQKNPVPSPERPLGLTLAEKFKSYPWRGPDTPHLSPAWGSPVRSTPQKACTGVGVGGRFWRRGF